MLKKIKLENFRNHRNFETELEDITAFIGPNGIGKSNVLEGICLLSFCRSFREEDKKNLVHFDSEFARVRGDDLEIFIQKNPYIFQAKANGVVKKQADFVGTLKSVVFSPESLLLLTDGPKSRRRFLDIMISQKSREYLRSLMNYEKIKKERNALLTNICEGRAREDQLSFWDDQIVIEGIAISQKRQEAASFINKELTEFYQLVSGKSEVLKMEYVSNIGEDFATELKANRRRDIAVGRTMIGPHKDDLIFYLEDRNVENFASRGEARSVILSLKMAEIKYLSEEGKKPILLLDDVFSEFDENRRNHLVKLVQNYQTVITTTDKEHLSLEFLEKAKVIELN